MGADPSLLFWLGWIALIGTAGLCGAIIDLKRGTTSFMRPPPSVPEEDALVSREEQPVEYWAAVGLKFVVVLMMIFMFWSGLGLLKW